MSKVKSFQFLETMPPFLFTYATAVVLSNLKSIWIEYLIYFYKMTSNIGKLQATQMSLCENFFSFPHLSLISISLFLPTHPSKFVSE